MNELIEDYQRKVNGVNELLKDKTNSEETINRLKIKVGCYRSFLTDLKRALNIDLVIWRCDEDVVDENSIKVFTKGYEYTQIPTGLLWVIDNEGYTHDINNHKFTSI